MNFLADAHAEWHHANGAHATCPLDCGASEVEVFDCVVCGASCAEYRDGASAGRDCTDPAACDKVLAEFRRVLAEEVAAEEAARKAREARLNPWEAVF